LLEFEKGNGENRYLRHPLESFQQILPNAGVFSWLVIIDMQSEQVLGPTPFLLEQY